MPPFTVYIKYKGKKGIQAFGTHAGNKKTAQVKLKNIRAGYKEAGVRIIATRTVPYDKTRRSSKQIMKKYF